MQLYEVIFQCHFEKLVDIGRALVCAQDQQMAKEIVIGLLDLPPTALTHCEVSRVKPNMIVLEREQVAKPQVKSVELEPVETVVELASRKGLQAKAMQFAQKRHDRRELREYIAQQSWAQSSSCGSREEIEYECEIFATVTAPDDETVLRRLGSALRERSNGITDESRHVRNVLINLCPELCRQAK